MAEVDWTNDEVVVRAALPTVFGKMAFGGTYIVRNARWGGVIGRGDRSGAFAMARRHPSVVAWEKANRPAEVETHEK